MATELDLLCDLLDQEVSDDDGTDNSMTNKDAQVQNTNEKEQQAEEVKNMEDCEVVNDDSDVEDMEQQLLKMQEQMRKMQEKLMQKKKTSSPSVSLHDVDLFSKPSTSASVRRSPVKTNPFEDPVKDRKATKLHPHTPSFGPALPKKSSRTLTEEEKKKALKEFGKSDKDSIVAMLRNDLADSSDEDAERNPLEEKYNDFGKQIRRISRSESLPGSTIAAEPPKKPLGFNQVTGATLNLSQQAANKALPKNLFVESNSRLRVANPLVDHKVLSIHMLGKKFVPVSTLKDAVLRKELSGDWVTIGVLFYKSTQTSKSGNTYTIWKLTDLVGEIKTFSFFLFGKAHARHYKMPLNKVVGILNAKVMDGKSSGGGSDASLSIDHPDKIMEIGDSLDLGKCQAKKPDGTGCTNLVNLSSCEYCIYHVKRAYKAMSINRREIQSAFSNNSDVRSRIMGKIDPKGEYFAGGQMLNKQLPMRSQSLGGSTASFPSAVRGQVNPKQRMRDLESLSSLGVSIVDKAVRLEELQRQKEQSLVKSEKLARLSDAEKVAVKSIAQGVSAELGLQLLNPTIGARTLLKHFTKEEEAKAKSAAESAAQPAKSGTQLLFEERKKLAEERAKKVLLERQLATVPKLGRGAGDHIDLSVSHSSAIGSSRAKAVEALKGKPIDRVSPNYVPARKRKAEDISKTQKKVARALGDDVVEEQSVVSTSSDGSSISKERMERIRNRKTLNQNLVDAHEDDENEKHLDLLEKKEALEEKMVSTREVSCKAVTCKHCNYTALGQSDLCKNLGHRVKVFDAKKRFYECNQCKNRTISLDKLPKLSCTKCGSNNWKRTGMAKERRGPLVNGERLLIRGAEQKFVNQHVGAEQMILD